MPALYMATCADLPGFTADEQLLITELAKRHIRTIPIIWTESAAKKLIDHPVLIRTTWDYHLQPEPFFHWINAIQDHGGTVWNSPRIIKSNGHKKYLLDLQTAGIRIPQSIYLQPDAPPVTAARLATIQNDRVIVKPAISANAHETHLLEKKQLTEINATVQKIQRFSPVLIQEFLPEIIKTGEYSLTFFGDEFACAVLKKAAPQDFRVQEDHGGSVERATISEELIRQARRILLQLPELPLYARVDGIVRDGELVLIELELIEPELFIRFDAEAPGKFAQKIAAQFAAL